MEIGLKERLIGAAVLVLLAVILIPLILRGPAPQSTVKQPLALPSAASTAPQAEYRLPLAGTASVAQPGAAPPAVAPAAENERHQPRPIAGNKPASMPAAAAPGKWAVQAGSYSSRDNAAKVIRRLEKRGYRAYVSIYRSSGRTYYRVRIGPYAERTAAERAAREAARLYGGKAEVVPNP